MKVIGCIECGQKTTVPYKKSYCSYWCKAKRRRRFKAIKKEKMYSWSNGLSNGEAIYKTYKQIVEPKKKLKPKTILRKPEKKSIDSKSFYDSRPWQELRYKVLLKHGRKCMCCFATNVELHVDHIKPISKFPELALIFDNLQVLCRDCNLGKSNKDDTDFRTHSSS
jgi:5-methylcytosine-specific restriction endonuclease McrA